jgi:alpha-methylacyl-CoA racemase
MSAILDGVRVVSLATNLPGPIAAARLTRLGASVTKIEPPGGDALAPASPRWYAELTSGQRVVVLDLKVPEDRARLDDELDGADLLMTAMRPSALARLGLASLADSYP